MSGPAWLAWGAVSALGVGVEPLLAGIAAGARGLAAPVRLAGALERTEVLGEVGPDGLAGAGAEGLAFHFARLAAEEALEGRSRRGLGLVLATTKGGLGQDPADPDRHTPAALLQALARALELETGPRAAVSCACASGLTALALAGRWLRGGRARRVLVVGVDALSPFVLAGFEALLALDPGPCRPFDRERRGLSLGEGAGALLLGAEGEEGLGLELAGWGASNDANHLTGPSRDGAGLALAAARALARAGLPAARLDYLHLHGTGTPMNDASEALAVRAVCGPDGPPASGSKAQLGHTLGAAGVLEAIVAGQALRAGLAPPNVGLVEPGVDPALRLVGGQAAPLPRAEWALKLAAGFGGIDAALVLRRRA